MIFRKLIQDFWLSEHSVLNWMSNWKINNALEAIRLLNVLSFVRERNRCHLSFRFAMETNRLELPHPIRKCVIIWKAAVPDIISMKTKFMVTMIGRSCHFTEPVMQSSNIIRFAAFSTTNYNNSIHFKL